jgi:hypothetical protein
MREDNVKVWTAAAYVAGSLVAATGCGGGDGDSFADQPIKQITQAVDEDMKSVKSLHMKGQLTSSGQKVGVDLSVTTGGQCEGAVSVGNGSTRVMSTGDAAWMKPDDAFWEQQAPDQAALIEQTVGDKWVVVPTDSSVASFCDLDSFLKSFSEDTNDSDGPTRKEGVESVSGQDALKLTGKSDGQDMTAWVAVDDPHHLLKLELGEGGAETTGTMAFSGFDEPVDVKTPAPSEAIDLDNLGG